MNTTQEYHYVYRITNTKTGLHYYGSRSCKKPPKDDLGKSYFSTFTKPWFKKDQKENPQDYRYKIIKQDFKIRDEANNYESKLHLKFDVRSHPKFINLANQLPNGFSHKGRVTVIDRRTGETTSVTIEEKRQNSEFVSIAKNTVKVYNKIDNTIITIEVNKFDEKQHRHINKDKVSVINLENGLSEQIDKKEFYGNREKYKHSSEGFVNIKTENGIKRISKEKFEFGDFQGNRKNFISVIDLNSGNTKSVSLSEYKNNSERYCMVWSNIINIYDSADNLQYRVVGNFRKFCKRLNLPSKEFEKSYNNLGKRLYEGVIRPCTLTRIENNGNIKYKGWYAIKEEK